MKNEDLLIYFKSEFTDCFQAANYLRALHGLPQVNIDVPLTGFVKDDHLINWYLKKSESIWVEMGLALINRHLVSLVTVDGMQSLLGVTKVNDRLVGTLYSMDMIHYPIYGVRNISRYSYSKARSSAGFV